jgi:hypothetical protein
MMDENRAPGWQFSRHFPALMSTALLAAFAAPHGIAATLVVSNTSASGAGSLQQAILDANAASGPDIIVFNIPVSGVQTISLTSALPAITDPVVIDGTTQPGYAGTPLIELSGANAGLTSDGLRLPAGNSTIRGLAINRFGGAGIHLQAPGASNIIQGNFIGTDPTGTLNRGNGQGSTHAGGVWIDGSSGNSIGGGDPTNRNVISGNGGSGVYVQNCSGNVVQGNLIGTSLSGTAALGNTTNGVSLYYSGGNQIGGVSATARNIISGNSWSGVYLFGPGSTGNLVQGNYIGTDPSGSLAIRNAADGVTMVGAPGNTIGGAVAGAGNLLSGNSAGGVVLQGVGATSNLVQGNYIGTDASGRLALGNTFSGITLVSGNSNLVGGVTAAARNIISANKLAGLFITNSIGNLVQGNFIGVDVTGTNALGNVANGISINGAGSNMIGGTTAEARNVISGNTNHGIEIFSVGGTSNWIAGNYIGPDVTGRLALGNKLCGVHIVSPANTIGGAASGAGNLISGNIQDGIFLDGANASNSLVQGNFIGTTAAGNSALMNARGGIGISEARGNTIGGTVPGAGNLVSANANSAGDAGIYLIGSGATGNVIQGNKIGTDVTGTLALGNMHEGIYLERATNNTIGGTIPGAGNLISANKTRGVFLVNAPWNVIQGNAIGTKIDGVSALGNTYHGVECELGACNTTIGGAGSAGNAIGFAQTAYTGVRIRNGSTNNAILGNSIFANGALGIDLGTAGSNPIIACGNGNGNNANMDQNFPVLSQAVSGNGTGIRGTLNSKANRPFLLQFFATPTCDGTGNGEGQVYLGQANVVTSNNCIAGFVVNLPVQVPTGYVITATATDSANNTSEFSACRAVAPVPALTINQSLATQQIALGWTNTATGFVLKQTDSLSPPIEWTTVTDAPVNTGGQFVVTLPLSTGNHFYLLSFE